MEDWSSHGQHTLMGTMDHTHTHTHTHTHIHTHTYTHTYSERFFPEGRGPHPGEEYSPELSFVNSGNQTQTASNKGKEFMSSCNWKVQKKIFQHASGMAGSRCSISTVSSPVLPISWPGFLLSWFRSQACSLREITDDSP